MKHCQKQVVRTCLFFLAAFFLAKLPAHCQRGTLGVDVGQTSDRFGGLARETATEGGIDGQLIVLRGNTKEGVPNIVAGGEIRLPAETSAHAPEFAAYVGPAFWVGNRFSIGFHAQVRKIYLPTVDVNSVSLNRDKMLLFELPAVLEYRFGSARHAFVQAQVSPEFTPHFTASSSGASPLPHPLLDHGYFIRGSAGYIFGKWYAKATYETRYFKFSSSLGNPNDLYNWRTGLVTGGVGFVF